MFHLLPSWIRGIVEVSKRYLMQVAVHNLGIILRKLLGVGTPRGWGSAAQALRSLFGALWTIVAWVWTSVVVARCCFALREANEHGVVGFARLGLRITPSSTGC